MLDGHALDPEFGIALGREVEYEDVLESAAAGHPLAVAITSAAGRALGRMMATIANIAMVDTIVLSGEDIALWNIVGDVAMAALATDRDKEATPVEVYIDDAGFDSWARGAAAVAIQAALGRLRLPA